MSRIALSLPILADDRTLLIAAVALAIAALGRHLFAGVV